MIRRCSYPHRRRAGTLIFVAVTAPVMLGFTALTIDVGYMYNIRAELQNAADSAALGAASRLPDEQAARAVALELAIRNAPQRGPVLADRDVHLGNWDPEYAVFTAGGEPLNAVRTATRCATVNGNPVQLFFAGILGIMETDISAGATAITGSRGTSNVPTALRRPDFGDVNPKNPYKPGPSMPANGEYFEVGEKVILGFNGDGFRDGVAITLDITVAEGDADLNLIITGKAELEDIYITLVETGDNIRPANPKGRYIHKLSKRLNYPSDHFLRDIVVPVVDVLPNSWHPRTHQLTGEVDVVDAVAVHIDGYWEYVATDPATGKTSQVSALMATVTGITGVFAPLGTDLGLSPIPTAPGQLVE